jgi:anti-sigma regulatory factor (Ser/Thr protein kinase)
MLKTDARNGVLSIITIYTTEEDGRQVTTFRVMEDEYVVEPFEVREIMALIEAEYARCADEGQALRQEARLTIPSEARDIVEATKTLENMLTPLPLEETARNAFLYAVREAIDNARRHGNREDPAKRIEARFILTGEAVAVEVRDEGPGFEYSYYLDNARELSAVEQARRKHEAGEHGGLGINLMLRCCDDVEYLDPGNAVRLTKRLS